jgi:hypothetical protein
VASRAESVTVNAAGLVQGIALVTFPAASTIFTARGSYNLSSSQYGAMFIPQVIAAIIASLLGAGPLWPGLAGRLSRLPAIFAASASWRPPWVGCPWWPRTASRRPPRCIPGRPAPGHGSAPPPGRGRHPPEGSSPLRAEFAAVSARQNSARSGGPRLIRG